MSNRVYDVLKWIALVCLPALSVLYLSIAQIWRTTFRTRDKWYNNGSRYLFRCNTRNL